MTTMLTASEIYVMDIESYETLQVIREQFLAAGAENAIVEDLTEEKKYQLRRQMWPERYNSLDAEVDQMESWDTFEYEGERDEMFDDNWTIWDEIDISPSDWLMGNF